MMEQTDRTMSGKTCLVTGATSGIGRVTALELARMGAQVVVVSRNPERCRQTVEEIRRQTGNSSVDFLAADLSSQAEIHRLARDFQTKHQNLHVLVNNVGGIFLWRRESAEGIEMTFALNHLSYFLLTNLLLDVLKSSSPARIVNVASNAHYGKRLKFDNLQFKRGYQGLKAYGCSKMANVLFTYKLSRQLEGSGVTANALHPGFVATNIGKDNGFIVRWIYPILERSMISAEEGAQTSLYLAVSLEVESISGKFFIKSAAVKSDPFSYKEDAQNQLWAISEALTKMKQTSS